MKKKVGLVLLLLMNLCSYSQKNIEDKKLPAGWDFVLLDGKTAYMNLITGTVSKIYPKKAALRPLSKLMFDPTITHKVKKGETLSVISRKYDLKLARLYRLNGLTNFDQLKIGQEVVIGYGQSKAEKTAFLNKVKYQPEVKSKTALNAEYAERFKLIVEKEPIVQNKPIVEKVKKQINSYHIVTASETLYGISVRYKLPIDTLKVLNNLKDNNIFMGQKLKIK